MHRSTLDPHCLRRVHRTLIFAYESEAVSLLCRPYGCRCSHCLITPLLRRPPLTRSVSLSAIWRLRCNLRVRTRMALTRPLRAIAVNHAMTGNLFMLVDLGGGTADITAHEVRACVQQQRLGSSRNGTHGALVRSCAGRPCRCGRRYRPAAGTTGPGWSTCVNAHACAPCGGMCVNARFSPWHVT